MLQNTKYQIKQHSFSKSIDTCIHNFTDHHATNSSLSKQTESNTQRNVPNTVSEEANKWRYFHSNLGNCKRTL